MEHEKIVATECEELLQHACSVGASDVYIMPKQTFYEVSLRKLGQISRLTTLPDELAIRMISYLKYLAALDISEKRKPQSGAFEQSIEDAEYAFRISTIPSNYAKESAVVRVLRQHYARPIEELCYHPQHAQRLTHLVEQHQGLILFTGATGSGKTTTLYSLIHYCQRILAKHVISLEDPVESSQEGILQIQVNERAGMTYASGLKAILRHTPDVIMIGEIRDQETAEIALEAALTGHLVLSTVHAKDSVGCLYRLHDLGLSLTDMQQALVAVIGQRLVKTTEQSRRAIYEFLVEEELTLAMEAKKQEQRARDRVVQ